jgi:GlcNAc-PI de-N-acetylase
MPIAPHPDDEALACSVILQKAVRATAAIHIVYVTDGDDNPWRFIGILEGRGKLRSDITQRDCFAGKLS